MRLTVFGATGGTGREIIKQALEAGHEVVAYVRNPAKLSQTAERLTVVQGEMNQPEKIRKAVAGADAVISALGPVNNKPERPLTAGMQNIINAMQRENVNRLIATTGAGVEAPEDKPPLVGKVIGMALRLFAKNVLLDSQGMVDAVQNSDLDWTVIRAPRLTDGPKTERVKVGYAGQGPGTMLTRADYAYFIISQLDDGTWSKKLPMVSN